LSEVWKVAIILDDPPVYIVGPGSRWSAVLTVFNLAFEHRAFLPQLEPCFFDLPLSLPQLCHP
jgi:hypothetical protein